MIDIQLSDGTMEAWLIERGQLTAELRQLCTEWEQALREYREIEFTSLMDMSRKAVSS